MTSVFENITQPDEPLEYYFAYIRTEDKLYIMQPNGENWDFEERVKSSAYTFARPDSETGNIYILKSYEGYDEATDKYYGTLYNGTRVELLNSQDLVFILTQVSDYGQMDYAILLGKFILHPVTTLPSAADAVKNYLDELIASNGAIFVEIDGRLKCNNPDSEAYYWDAELQNFIVIEEEPTEEPIYTGPLDWEDVPNSTFATIPYQGIIKEETISWVFHPKKGGEIISTYWIYTNGEWVNIDDIKNPTDYIAMPFTSFGSNVTAIPLNKIHIYLDDNDEQLTIIPVYSKEGVIYDGLIYIQIDEEITTEHTFKFVLDNDVTFGDLGAGVHLTGFWGTESHSAVNQETFTATVSGDVGKLELVNSADNPR